MGRRLPPRAERGSTLVTVTILLGTMTVLALVFLRVGQRLTQEQDSSLEAARAGLLAEAGISEAVAALRAGQSGNVANAGAPAYLGGGVLWVEATDLGGGRTRLDSMAMKEGGRAAYSVVVDTSAGGGPGGAGGEDGFVGMLFANKHLQLDQDITIDSYDSTLGTYASQATNTYGTTTYAGSEGSASSNTTVQIDAGVKVFGDVACGPNTAPTMAATSYVSGSTAPRAQTVTLAPIPVPSLAASGAYSVGNNATKTIPSGKYHYTSLTQGKFSKLTVVGPATLVLDSYSTGTSATLELDCTNGPISIYVTGTCTMDKNYTVGPAPGSPLDAAFLVSSTDTVQFKQGSKIEVGFYVPDGRIQVDQGAEVWGALVANEIEVNQGTRFHFDVNLREFELPWEIPADPGAAGDPVVISWTRIEFPVREYRTDRRDPLTLLGVTRADLRAPSEAWEEPGTRGGTDQR